VNEIQSTLLSLLPPKRKSTLSGWNSFDAPCCHHRGETRDKHQRGGVRVENDGFVFHCFNCNFAAGWTPGKLLSKNTKDLFKWLGLNEFDIGKLNLLALKIKDDQPVTKKFLNLELLEKPLPEDCLPIDTWIAEGAQDTDLLDVISYLVEERKVGWDWYNWHWSAAPGYRDRVIIPFYQDGKIVGYTGRKIKAGKPKYLTDSQSGYVFNIDRQTRDRKYVIVVEGQFDAIAIDGVGIMTNEPNDAQILRINSLGKEVIVVPDKDRPGAKLVSAAVKNQWSASLPPWEDGIKDVADAVKKYGRLYVLTTILHYKVGGEINLHLLKKKLEAINDE
jgi:DNA primase catalytic core, N-terminal domain